MSFDIFLACVRNGQPSPLPRDLYESIFLPHAEHPDAYKNNSDYLVVEYPDGGGASIYFGGDNDDAKSNMMVNHFGGEAFYADLYKFAHLTRSIIFWPTKDPIYLYTDPTLPAELKGMSYFEEARGIFIRSGAEIEPAIASN